jgi:hypothetical protein
MFQLTITVPVRKFGVSGFVTAGGAILPNGFASPAAAKVVKRRLSELGTDLKSMLINEAPTDTGNIRRAHGFAVDVIGSRLIVFNRAGYSVPVHEGRGVGKKRPPIAALIPWARRHLVNSRIANALIGLRAIGRTSAPGFNVRKVATRDEQKLARQLAFLVARAIGRRGIKPNKWFTRVFEGPAKPRIDRAGSEISKDLGKLTAAHVEQAFIDSLKGFAT